MGVLEYHRNIFTANLCKLIWLEIQHIMAADIDSSAFYDSGRIWDKVHNGECSG